MIIEYLLGRYATSPLVGILGDVIDIFAGPFASIIMPAIFFGFKRHITKGKRGMLKNFTIWCSPQSRFKIAKTEIRKFAKQHPPRANLICKTDAREGGKC